MLNKIGYNDNDLFENELNHYSEFTYQPKLSSNVPNILDLQMFGNPEDEGRTEEPTEYKKRKAREEGRVAKSQEFTAGLTIVAIIFGLLIFGGYIENSIREVFHVTIGRFADINMDTKTFSSTLGFVLQKVLFICAPVFGIAFAIALITNLAQVGFNFTTKPLTPKFEKIKPNFKKIFFSVKTAFNLLKSVLKVLLVAGVLTFLLSAFIGNFFKYQ